MNRNQTPVKSINAATLRRYIWKVLTAIFGLFLTYHVVLFIGFFAIPEMYHQLRWQAFANPFLNYPLPPNTTEIRRERSFGNLVGTGNSCSYRVTRLLATELSLEDIEAYYRDVSFPAVDPISSGIGTLLERTGFVGVAVRLKEIITVSDAQRSLKLETEIFDGPYPPFGFQCG